MIYLLPRAAAHTANMPPKPPLNRVLAPAARKRKQDSCSASNVTAAQRARQVEATQLANVPRDSPFLNPFQPAAAPCAFEPEMSVAESEELTRR